MRTLEEIRKANKRSDLLLSGMEMTPVNMPLDLRQKEEKFYHESVKPHLQKVLIRNLVKKKLWNIGKGLII